MSEPESTPNDMTPFLRRIADLEGSLQATAGWQSRAEAAETSLAGVRRDYHRLTLAHQGHLQLLGELLGHAPEELVDVGDLSVDIRTLQRDLAQARAALAGRGVG